MKYKFGKPINEYPNYTMYNKWNIIVKTSNNYNYNIIIIPKMKTGLSEPYKNSKLITLESTKCKIYGKNLDYNNKKNIVILINKNYYNIQTMM